MRGTCAPAVASRARAPLTRPRSPAVQVFSSIPPELSDYRGEDGTDEEPVDDFLLPKVGAGVGVGARRRFV